MADIHSFFKDETHECDGRLSATENRIYCSIIDASAVVERRLMRRIDLHVIPWLSVLYILSFMDRGSIGNAKLFHLEEDININDGKYLIALSVFFLPYAVFEPASNVILRKLKPSLWLSTMMLLWGVVMTLHGFIRNYSDLIILRFLLGITEGGLYPGIVFYISSWYKRSEMGSRIAIFFSSAAIAGAFSGLLAAAIDTMDGVGGRPGWSWIFIIEGLATVLASFASFWLIQDFPDTAEFLSEAERVFVVRRLENDMKLSAAGEVFKAQYLLQSLTDWKTWVASIVSDGPLYAFSLFLPSTISQVSRLRFQATEANLLCVPVYVWGCISTCAIGFLGDRIGTPNSVAWLASNVEGSYKRSVTLGMAIGFGNINGAVTANIVRDRPWYRLGHGVVLAYIATSLKIGFGSSILFARLLERENARRDRGERDEVIEGVENEHARERNGKFGCVEAARAFKGDEWSGFRYTL
ncbi:hypothetical protein K443DRAFT_129105 [Laccaria amethystina LaAM-08-1]|uniref:Major facilitator superfamily (MFS) profile domain-containing protein n=1 Tax=Laccaria amethystina LaAM-08-1 TaxID=1095629 RepID=A0A0C9YB07_9AGAR|nr:hypothetical protein K443DRAFT_129105 [Laccaria amethystina LaAM-08-1]